MFWGRVDIKNATAYYFFQKGGRVQAILHKFKYKNQIKIGYYLGRMAGSALKKSGFSDIDLIIPVPLHEVQYKKRGFNQSEVIAKGLGRGMDKPVDINTLFRVRANPTQTRKNRYDRWVNVKGIFELRSSELIENKHVLLVDDVVTTGATLEACAYTLLKGKNVKVSIFALAKA
jgi:ComF family protein